MPRDEAYLLDILISARKAQSSEIPGGYVLGRVSTQRVTPERCDTASGGHR
jgi:hypothetical protein